jgi:hypothetical protein
VLKTVQEHEDARLQTSTSMPNLVHPMVTFTLLSQPTQSQDMNLSGLLNSQYMDMSPDTYFGQGNTTSLDDSFRKDRNGATGPNHGTPIRESGRHSDNEFTIATDSMTRSGSSWIHISEHDMTLASRRGHQCGVVCIGIREDTHVNMVPSPKGLVLEMEHERSD